MTEETIAGTPATDETELLPQAASVTVTEVGWRETWTIAGVVTVCCLVTAFTIAIVGWVISLQQRDAVLPALVPGASTPTLAPPPPGLLPQERMSVDL